MKNTVLTILSLCLYSNTFSQNNLNKTLTVGFGFTKSYNSVIQETNNFKAKGFGMGRAFASWEQKYNKLYLGASFEFYNTSYEYIDRSFENKKIGNSVGLYFHSGGFVNVIALGISAKYPIINGKIYQLRLKLSPKVGYVVKGFYLSNYDNLEERGASNHGRDFFFERPGKWYSKGLFPLLSLEVEQEIKVAKRSGIVLTVGYQQGFVSYFKDPMRLYRQYDTPNQTIEDFEVHNKGNMLFYQISYRQYFGKQKSK